MANITIDVRGINAGGSSNNNENRSTSTATPNVNAENQQRYREDSQQSNQRRVANQPSEVYSSQQGVSGSNDISGSTIHGEDVSRREDIMQPNERLIEELRKQIISQGSVYAPGTRNYKQVINAVYQQQLQQTNREITEEYDERKADVNEKIDAIIQSTKEKYYAQRNREFSEIRPEERKNINAKWDTLIQKETSAKTAPYEEEIKELDEKIDAIIQSTKEKYEKLRSIELNGVTEKEQQDAINEKWDKMSESETKSLAEPLQNQIKQIEEKINSIVSETKEKYDTKREEELGSLITDKERRTINKKYDEATEEEITRLAAPYEKQLDDIEAEEAEARINAEKELKDAVEELTIAIQRSGSLNPESYLGQLRMQRQEAIFERDTAEDEETAREAAERVRELDEQIKSVTEGEQAEEGERGINFGDRALQILLGSNQMISGIANKNFGSMIMGGGQAVTSMLGLSDETAAKTLAWLQPFAFVGSLLTQEGLKSDQMAGLAALLRTQTYQGQTLSIEDVRMGLYDRLNNLSFNGGPSINAMGLSAPEFAQSAERRMSQRGMTEYGLFETYMQESLERVFSLTRGSLGEAGKYDRYGISITDAISNLVSRLERVSTSGVTQGDYVRVQEYLSMQQQLMSNYSRFTNEPDYMAANRDIEAFSKIGGGYQIDSRTAGDIQSVQNAIMNPQNERMKSILYGVVEETVPEYNGKRTAGRVDLIDQAINDPKYQGMIERAFMKRLEDMYGGVDTPMGYLMVKSLLPGIESPERRKMIFEGITSGEAGKVLADKDFEGKYGTRSQNYETMVKYSGEIKGYVSTATETLIKLSDTIFENVSTLERIANNITKIANGGFSSLFN